jgi:signal recognition particle subunit SRP54
MFENLSEKLQRAFKNLRGQGTLNEENMQEALREIRLALLEADVNFKVVKELIDHIREKAIGSEVMLQISPTEQVVKIVHDELINILGKDTAKIRFGSQPPTVVLMAGLQGSGKTTRLAPTSMKAKWMAKRPPQSSSDWRRKLGARRLTPDAMY